MWVVLGALFIFGVLIPAWVILTDIPPTRSEQFADDLWRTNVQIGQALKDTRIAMEEAAGVRRPGERRMGDDLGSWRDW